MHLPNSLSDSPQGRNYLEQLPQELLLMITEHLPLLTRPQSLVSLMYSSRSLNYGLRDTLYKTLRFSSVNKNVALLNRIKESKLAKTTLFDQVTTVIFDEYPQDMVSRLMQSIQQALHT